MVMIVKINKNKWFKQHKFVPKKKNNRMNAIILCTAFLLPTLLFFRASLTLHSHEKFSSIFKFTQAAIAAALLGSVTGVFWLINFGPTEVTLFEMHKLGLTVRLDTLSIIMYFMISIIAFVVLRFSKNYLDGDPEIIQFFRRLALTIAFVQILVLAGNIATLFVAWVGTSIGLHQLLRFYPKRKKALLAAHKKFIIARLGDLMLLIALLLIYFQFGSGNLSYIFEQLQQFDSNSLSFQLEIAALFLVLSAALKSVQVPFHGWLLDVMEAPTPVSALLHAGLLNAGPFLIIRFAFLIDIAQNASNILIMIGAISALFGAIVAITQPAIKTGLAYSSIGHMGFSLMVCGFGVYSASLLHLVAHSFYKAHAFLSSGSIIEKVQTKNAINYNRLGKIWRIIFGLFASIILYFLIAYVWGINANSEFQLLVIGFIIFFGVLSIQINSFDSNISVRSISYLLIGSGIVINFFFIFESLIHSIIQSQIPEIREPSLSQAILSFIVLATFFVTVLMQLSTSKTSKKKISKKIGVHVRNGLYFNLIFDKMMNALNTKPLK